MRTRLIAVALLVFFSVQSSTVTAAPLQSPSVKWVTLGTGGGPLPRVNRAQPANALIVGDVVYLFDVGDGVQRQLAAAQLPTASVRAVFLSHHHIDHTAGLGPFLFGRWLFNLYAPIPVVGPPGTVAMISGLAVAYRPAELAPITVGGPRKPPFGSSVKASDLGTDLVKPTIVYQDDNIRVLAVLNDHYHFEVGTEPARFSRSYSYRIETGSRIIAYSGDTGPSSSLTKLAADADLLVSEVIDMPAMKQVLANAPGLTHATRGPLLAHMEQDHLTPEQIGNLAQAARVKRVVLTHVAPGMDGQSDVRHLASGVARLFNGPVVVANDLDRF